MAASEQDPYVDVACWMREIGMRTGKSMEASLPPVSRTRYIVAEPSRPLRHTLRQSLSLAALVVAYLQYHFFGVQVQITLLHSVIFFLFPV